MARRKVYKKNRKNKVLPSSNRTTETTPNFLVNKDYRRVFIKLEDNFYLNGSKYTGIAYKKNNNVFVRDIKTKSESNLIKLIYKSNNNIKQLTNSRVIAKSVRANLQNDNVTFRNNKRDERIKKIIQGAKRPTKTTTNLYRKLGKK